MLLFRSEEHIRRWCDARSLTPGAIFSPAQMWAVAKPWFERRLHPDWRRYTADEAELVFTNAGLTGDFWKFQRQAGSVDASVTPRGR
jgi:hypothetical protein